LSASKERKARRLKPSNGGERNLNSTTRLKTSKVDSYWGEDCARGKKIQPLHPEQRKKGEKRTKGTVPQELSPVSPGTGLQERREEKRGAVPRKGDRRASLKVQKNGFLFTSSKIKGKGENGRDLWPRRGVTNVLRSGWGGDGKGKGHGSDQPAFLPTGKS